VGEKKTKRKTDETACIQKRIVSTENTQVVCWCMKERENSSSTDSDNSHPLRENHHRNHLYEYLVDHNYPHHLFPHHYHPDNHHDHFDSHHHHQNH
jgi:hypothetical protein